MGDNKETAPFNMALATLERVNDLLKNLQFISLTQRAQPAKAQYIKYHTTNDLFIAAVPLLVKGKDKKKKTIKEELSEIKLKTKQLHEHGKSIGAVELYCPQAEQQLNDVIILISEYLGDEGYFMPPKEDITMLMKQ